MKRRRKLLSLQLLLAANADVDEYKKTTCLFVNSPPFFFFYKLEWTSQPSAHVHAHVHAHLAVNLVDA
jgi:hypothetical protein